MNEYMSAADINEMLSASVLMPPELVELIAGAVFRINERDDLMARLTIWGSLDKIEVEIYNVTRIETVGCRRFKDYDTGALFQFGCILDDQHGLDQLYRELEKFA